MVKFVIGYQWIRMFCALRVLVLLFGSLGATSVVALSDYERSVLRVVEDSLNRSVTGMGRFTQISASGSVVRGNLYLSRPGKMRFEYDPPNPLMIVSDGYWVMQVDKELENTSSSRLSLTPLSFILAENISFENGVNVASMETVGNSILITVFDPRKPADGTLTLIVDSGTMALQAWQIVDKRGERTTVRLENMSYNVNINPDLFVVPSHWRAGSYR